MIDNTLNCKIFKYIINFALSYKASTRMSNTNLFDEFIAGGRCQQWGLTLTQHDNIIKMIRQNPDGKMFVLTIIVKEDGALSCMVDCTQGLNIGIVHQDLRSFFIPVVRADAFTVMAYLADIRGNLREFFGA